MAPLFAIFSVRQAVYDMEEFLLYEGDDYKLLSAVIGAPAPPPP